ncbi:hypothetical protein FE257_004280 [Aspergillus nanangensis]|uniref:Heterokaryon incompatibility domain-containing protein n=1 Tax=Aspergillus nanangensis TaxID=2582783 RepID=A0AAD4CRK6_ASPNN|nr:hypothetical protein FE257_004280 [Aspergillus nanangensis]
MASNRSYYQYTPLHRSGDEIRLIDLHPGEFSDEIWLTIRHTSLPHQQQVSQRKLSLDELRASVPQDWEVYDGLEGRTFFYWEDGPDKWVCTWKHPDPDIASDLYEFQTIGPRTISYEAVSYTWGSTQTEKTPVYIVPVMSEDSNDITPLVQELRIGENLANALRHLRYGDKPRTLWVDAICINQADVSEKEGQVKRISTIFKEADQVVVWLGLASSDSSEAIEALDYIGKQVVITTDKWTFTSPEAVEIEWCYSNFVIPYAIEIWQAINSLLHRAWFNRVWVVQEIQLSTTAVLQCGFDVVSWTHFRRALVLLFNKQAACPGLSRQRVHFLQRLVDTVHAITPIYQTFHLTDGRDCMDPRDLIYGVLGLFPQDFRVKVNPQYSLSVGGVYTSFVRSHIQHVHRLELLRDCQLDGRTLDAPTWVPDYANKRNALYPIEWQFCSGYSGCAIICKEPDILDVIGVYSATVRTVEGPIPNYRHSNATFQDSLRAIEALLDIGFAAEDAGGDEHGDIFARTLSGNYLKDRFPDRVVATLEEWKKSIHGPDRFTDTVTNEETLTFQQEYALRLLLGRVYFTTDEGYIGLGPPGAQPDDIIVCLLGCNSPMLLRKAPQVGFLVVGECFVHELNDAKGILGLLPVPWQVQGFTEASDRYGVYRYFNTETKVLVDRDPRILAAPENCDRDSAAETGHDSVAPQPMLDKTTGGFSRLYPEMTVEALKACGVALRWFPLV